MEREITSLSDKLIYTNLIQRALSARENAYCPYSGYAVGAALLTDDHQIITGCNVENASYGATNCAERTAFFKAVSEGYQKFKAIVICGGMKGEKPVDYAYPCGMCRQVMSEFANGDFHVIVAKSEDDFLIYTLAELLPHSFGDEQIQ